MRPSKAIQAEILAGNDRSEAPGLVLKILLPWVSVTLIVAAVCYQLGGHAGGREGPDQVQEGCR